jgi:hypothetical protein
VQLGQDLAGVGGQRCQDLQPAKRHEPDVRLRMYSELSMLAGTKI